MNNRFKELERQADEYADGLGLAGDEWCDAQSTKFAELIIRECAKFTDSKLVFDDDSGECLNWVEGSNLLEHFGVEE